jgi:serine/threonine-protein kinase
LAREVAIKEFFPWGSVRDERRVIASSEIEYSTSRAAFTEEARALARFDHPHIVRVYSVFEENNSAYIVEEFLHGHTLQHELNEDGALPFDEAIETLRPVCGAVETLHGVGLIHGDIKPANIFRTHRGRVVLLDFGLTASLPSGDYATTLLAPQRGVGTAGYAPLEQYSQSGALSPATDVYALAATLWHLLTGDVPPDAPGRASGVPLPDIRVLVPDINDNVSHALEHGLAMNASHRPQDVRSWWNEIINDKEATENIARVPVMEEALVSSFLVSPTVSSFQPPTHYESQPEFPWSLILLSCSLFALLATMMLWR